MEASLYRESYHDLLDLFKKKIGILDFRSRIHLFYYKKETTQTKTIKKAIGFLSKRREK